MSKQVQCDFAGCEKPISGFSKSLKSGLRFCEDHDKAFKALADANDIEGILRFWRRSKGSTTQSKI